MDTVLSIILIGAVLGLLAYFLLQAWNAGYKIYKRLKKKRERRAKKAMGHEQSRDESQNDGEQEIDDDLPKNLFAGHSIRRSELYEGLRGNRNLFEVPLSMANTVRNPLWLKEQEVEEAPMELEFWQAPEKAKVQRDDDEVLPPRVYDPSLAAPQEGVPYLEQANHSTIVGPPPGEVEMETVPKKNRSLIVEGELDSLDASQISPRKASISGSPLNNMRKDSISGLSS